jgi:hypothetical protein
MSRQHRPAAGGAAERMGSNRVRHFVGGPRNLLPLERAHPQLAGNQRVEGSAGRRIGATSVHLGAVACTTYAQAIEFELGNWRRRPDLNRGWRFCRHLTVFLDGALLRLLVVDARRFCPLLGPYCSEIAPRLLRWRNTATRTLPTVHPANPLGSRRTRFCRQACGRRPRWMPRSPAEPSTG